MGAFAANQGGAMNSQIELTVNGRLHRLENSPGDTLLDVLRNHLGLKGTRFGCGLEQCGSCMVLVDGEAVLACTRELSTVHGRAITTVEGLAQDDVLHPVQSAFLSLQAGQCGYCLSGIIMSAVALLTRTPQPSRAKIIEALDKHLCRCGAHQRIVMAVQAAAQSLVPDNESGGAS
jgi:nicotinate dehydrogenase subunit A